jgi:hypothetical protein
MANPLFTRSLLLLPRSSSVHSSVFDHSHRRSPSNSRHLIVPRLYGFKMPAYTVGTLAGGIGFVSASIHRNCVGETTEL